MNKTVPSNFDEAQSSINISLQKSYISKDSVHYAKVSRKTVTVENIIAAIMEENHGLDPVMIQHAITLFQQQVLKQLKLGNSINMMDLGNLYIAMKGSIDTKSNSPCSDSSFVVKFTPSPLTQATVANLAVNQILLPDTEPHINYITDSWSKTQNQIITPGKICLIKGNNLKLGGNTYSISFYETDNNGNINKEKEAIEVPAEHILQNTNKKLQFYIPETLQAGKSYVIKISTMYLNNGKSRKSSVETISNVLSVNEFATKS